MDVRGIDHVGLTVPDIEVATRFLVEALDAEVLYDTLQRADGPRRGPGVTGRLGIPAGAEQVAIRMLALPSGPGLELFEYRRAPQAAPVVASDLGWQHVAIYVDDVHLAVDRVVSAGGQALSEPHRLSGMEAGANNWFVYCLTPWGSTLELISYPDPQPYEAASRRRRWRP